MMTVDSSIGHQDVRMFCISYVSCWDKAKRLAGHNDAEEEVSKISTGIAYLDHMLDQFNSHAQIGLSIIVDRGVENESDTLLYQNALMESIGKSIGAELAKLMPSGSNTSVRTSEFSCPLDEALVECTIETSPGANIQGIFEYAMAPYGIYPRSTGRTCIGQMKTQPLEIFWRSLAQSMNLSSFKMRKLRGHNGHHIVESSFKAFCRALRCYIDRNQSNSIWGIGSDSFSQGIAMQREASINRSTKETSIKVTLKLDGGKTESCINTSIPFLDEFYTTVVSACPSMSLLVECQGDTYVDDHHTTEDVAIAIGQVLHKALGTKAGLNRMWSCEAQREDARVKVVMDLSNRPCLFHDLVFCPNEEEMLDPYTSIEMIPHLLESLVVNGQMTIHIVQLSPPTTDIRDLILATACALGQALYYCTAVDPRRSGAIASSKGTLSV